MCINVLNVASGLREHVYLVVRSDGPELHDELKAQEVVGPDGLELQEAAERDQLGSGQVVQSELVLEQLGELYDLLVARTFPGVPDLQEPRRHVQVF